MRQVSVKLPEDVIARLDAVAAERGVRRIDVIREACAQVGAEPVEVADENEIARMLSSKARAGNTEAMIQLARLQRARAKTPEEPVERPVDPFAELDGVADIDAHRRKRAG